MTARPAFHIEPIDRLQLTLVQKPWPFAVERRDAIAEYFAGLKRDKPSVWNGRVLLMHRSAIKAGVFTGEFLESDFADFAAWRAWGRPESGIEDCFASAAILSADGACLLGVMGSHTANAGAVYFPSGTPDPNDVVDGSVDFDVSLQRELREETGLGIDAFDADPGWIMVRGCSLVAMIKPLRSRDTADVVRARILDNLARDRQPEFSDIRIVRGPADFDEAVRPFVRAFLHQLWRR